jgi:hypothetical protein
MPLTPTPPTNWRWLHPTNDPEAYDNALAQLGEWVTWLIERYAIDTAIPPCWEHHGAIVE